MSFSKRVQAWLNDRLGLDDLPFFRTPDYMYKVNYWLGALVAASFIYAVISGLFLLLYYYPENAYNETQYIINSVPYGSVFLFSHLYASYAMILLAYVHMFRNYFAGAYKKPRELLWILGVLMLLVTLGASFVGYSLVGDVLGIDAVGVGKGLLATLPGGNTLDALFFGNGTTEDLFTRLLAWHIILVALIGALFVFHFMMAERYGMMPSHKEKEKAPSVYTKEEWMRFNPWWPRNFVYMMSLIFMTWGMILIVPDMLANVNGLPLLLDPHPAPSPTSPQAATVPAYPPWFFLFFYKIADFETSSGQPYSPLLAMTIAVIIPLVFLLLVPFLDRSEELNPFKRKFFTWAGIMLITYLVQTSIWGYMAPGVPESFILQVEVFLPPAIISAVAVYLVSSQKGLVAKKGTFSPISALVLMVLGLTLAGTLADFLSHPTLLGVDILTPITVLFLLYARSNSPTWPEPFRASQTSLSTSESVKPQWKVKLAEVLISVLFLMSVVIALELWTIPSTGPQSSYWGVGLGTIFLMMGEAISLYHYVVYKK